MYWQIKFYKYIVIEIKNIFKQKNKDYEFEVICF